MVTDPVKTVPVTTLVMLRNLLAQREEEAHVQFIRNRTDLPNLAAHYQGSEVAFGLVRVMLDSLVRGVEPDPNDAPWGAGEAVEASRG